MKKNLYIIGMGLAALLALTSCEDWFDISAKSELKAEDLLSNEQGFRDALIGCYGTMKSENLYGAQLTMTYMDVLGQYFTTPKTSLNTFEYANIYDYANQKEETRKDAIWKDLYNVVANTNSLLGQIDGHKGVFAANEYELIKGESLGLRAFLHFDLLRLFAPSASMSGGLQQPAIPYVDRFTNGTFPRLTVEGVLARIADDLTAARALLKDVDPYGPNHAQYERSALAGIWKGREYRMNYYATTALLARVLLYRNHGNDRSQAFQLAREVIDSGLFPLITSNDVSSADKNGFVQENIFALESKEVFDNVAKRYFYAVNTSQDYLAFTQAALEKVFPATLNMDYRRLWWIETTGSYSSISKYNSSKRIPLLKVSEMYLIAAETAPSLTEANKYFNALQYHRGLPDEELTSDNLSGMILKEYAKEFIGEGQLFFAYKRLRSDVTPINQTAVTSPGKVYVLPLPVTNTYFQN
ncbi:MAG: RagB/SusD family nutrient uptake outer membrane protein [Prevotella sp.]|nr:RagB/SusD family nutrient uptake outer membrane protein [Prevotella sp.]